MLHRRQCCTRRPCFVIVAIHRFVALSSLGLLGASLEVRHLLHVWSSPNLHCMPFWTSSGAWELFSTVSSLISSILCWIEIYWPQYETGWRPPAGKGEMWRGQGGATKLTGEKNTSRTLALPWMSTGVDSPYAAELLQNSVHRLFLSSKIRWSGLPTHIRNVTYAVEMRVCEKCMGPELCYCISNNTHRMHCHQRTVAAAFGKIREKTSVDVRCKAPSAIICINQIVFDIVRWWNLMNNVQSHCTSERQNNVARNI